MLGKLNHNPPVIGLVPMTMNYFLELGDRAEVSLSAVETYGVKPSHIQLYDLFHAKNDHNVTGFDPNNPEEHWDKMFGSAK